MRSRMMNALLVAVMLFAIKPAYAAFDDELTALQKQWATVRYQTSGDERKIQLEKLVVQADGFTNKYSDKAESHLWAGVIRGSLAEAINGLSALTIVKEAKAHLEKSIAIDPKAEDSYALGVLGLMYAKVPGWPVGFGDNEKAKELLKKGMGLSPEGMNINYLYASYLFDQDDNKQAQVFIDKALRATPPADIWNGRQQEIRELAEKIKKESK